MNNQAKVSGWLDSLVNVGLTIFGATQQNAGGAASTQAKGLAAITAFVNQVLSALDTIKSQITALTPAQKQQAASQAMAQAQEIAATLSNAAYVYQARNGQDAAVLANGKTSAAQKIQEISAILQGATNQPTNPPINPPIGNPPTTQPTRNNTTPVTLPSGQVIYIQSPVATTSIFGNLDDESKQYLLYGGIAVAVYLLLKK